ncbi:hypothetical protein V6N13_089668 [Hibiscus sabdariffa]
MALDDEPKVTSNSSLCDLSYNELFETYEELQEVYDELVEKYKESILKNKKIISDLKNDRDSLYEANYDLELKIKSMQANQKDLEKKNQDLHGLLSKVQEDHQKEVGDLKASLNKGEHCYKSKASSANSWYLDSGCSRHMTDDKSRFLEFKSKSGGVVTFGDNSKGNIEGIGSIAYRVFNKRTLVVEESMHVVFDDNLLPRKDSCDDDDVGILQSNGGEPSSKVDEVPTKEESQDPPLEALNDMNLEEREVASTMSKALYGLKQAPRAWYERLSTFLVEKGFSKGKVDTTLFIKNDGKDILVVQIYVDDIIFGSTNELLCQDFAKWIQGEFEMSMMGELSFFLGLQIKQRKDDIFINQAKYIKEKLKKFGFENVKPQATPMSSSIKLDKDEEGKCVDSKLYCSMIGSLLYLTASRPDIMFSVCLCARFQANPKESHLKAVKRIFRYLQDTLSLGLWYSRDSTFDLHAYSDADYGGCKIDRKSTSGTCQFLGNMLISWFSNKQNSVALSTTEAEYISADSCCAQVLWMKQQLLDYGIDVGTIPIKCDNTSAICLTKNPIQHSRTKHIEIRHHFIRDHVSKNDIVLEYVDTLHQLADIFIKPLDKERFWTLRRDLGLMDLS